MPKATLLSHAISTPIDSFLKQKGLAIPGNYHCIEPPRQKSDKKSKEILILHV